MTERTSLFPNQPLGDGRYLISRAYMKPKAAVRPDLIAHSQRHPLLIDCGAFTFKGLGNNPYAEVEDYCCWLDGLKVRVDRYFQLDVMRDPSRTRANLEYMRENGYDPIPIWQRTASVRDLHELIDGTPDHFVAIGGLVGSERYRLWVRHHVLPSLPEYARIHLLGMTRPSMIWDAPRVTSCDSSEYMRGYRYGEMRIYWGGGRFSSTQKGLSGAVQRRIRELVGFDWRDLLGVFDRREMVRGREVFDKRLAVGVVTAVSEAVYRREVLARFGIRIYQATHAAMHSSPEMEVRHGTSWRSMERLEQLIDGHIRTKEELRQVFNQRIMSAEVGNAVHGLKTV